MTCLTTDCVHVLCFSGPPTTEEKVSVLMQIFDNDFGPSVVTAPRPVPRPNPRPPGGWSRHRYSFRMAPPPPPPPSPPLPSSRYCSYENPRDLAVVIDSSGSVGQAAFSAAVDTLADFIGNMCHEFTCQGPQTRLAIVTYGSEIKEAFNFQYAAGRHRSEAQMINDIKTKPIYTGGYTATGTALEYCRDNIFQTRYGMRNNSKRQILLLTDGHSNRGTAPGDVARQLFGGMDVAVYALGIGYNINLDELKSITHTRSNNNMLHVMLAFANYGEFSRINDQITRNLRVLRKSCIKASVLYDKKK